MILERKRYIILRNNRTEVFCGLARDYKFKPINEIGDSALKTYSSKAKAENSFKCSWRFIDFDYEIVEIVEKIECCQ